ncbi:MAG: polysaccharide deacetylase family protein [Bacteroidetes bacterium]|nr:polysaccharide deacetylase family protein [Bacteroidota bacterium]
MRLTRLFFILLAFNCHGQSPTDNEPTGRAIICLTYDDAIESQLYVAIPQLDSMGLKATFFLNSIRGSTEAFGIGEPSVLGWKKAAQNGHELGNHTLFHPCPTEIGWQKEIAIESYSMDKLLREIELTNQFLNVLEEKSKIRAYAFPCNNTIVGGQDYSNKLREKKIVSYARWGGPDKTIIYNFATLNPMKVPSWLVSKGTTLHELIDFAKAVKSKGKMGVYQFHGIGSPLFTVSPTVHRQFLEYLKSNQADYWVTTFSSAMDYVTSKWKK